MKGILIKSIGWGIAMFAGLVAIDLLRRDPVNWFVAILAGVFIAAFMTVLGRAEAKNREAKQAEENKKE